MPARRTRPRWEHPTYRYAYVCEFRGMACTVIHGSDPVSTGYAWKPSSRVGAMRVLDHRLELYRRTLQGHEEAPRLFGDLLAAYGDVKFGKISYGQRRQHMTAAKLLVEDTLPITSHARIREQILERLAALPHGVGTKRGMLKRLRAIFAFGISEGWLAVNPVHKDMIPAEPQPVPDPYTHPEITAILGALDGREKLYIAFLAATACRAGEAVALQWPHVHADHVVIDGKRRNRDTPSLRSIPYALAPEVPQILEAMQANRDRKTTDGVFGIKSYTKMALRLRAACELAGVRYRGLHAIRSYKVNRWLKHDRWPESLLTAIAGHDMAVSKKHYRTAYSVDELVGLASGSTLRVAS